MNLAIDIRSLMDSQLTGVGGYCFNIVKHLLAIDRDNNYYLFYNSARKINLPRFDYPNVHYCRFRYPNKFFNLSLLLLGRPRLDGLIEKKYAVKIDLFLFPNINFIRVNCPYIITAHDLSFELFPEFLSRPRQLWHGLINPRRLFQNAARVIAVSENTGRDLQAQYQIPNSRITVVYSGVEPEFFQDYAHDPRKEAVKKKYGLPDKFILYLGTLEPRKNIETLVRAFIKFKHNNKNPMCLVIAGHPGWHYKKIWRLARESLFSRNIIFTDYIDNDDKPFVYAQAKLFVFPSYYEGFGFPPLEALAQRVPVIIAGNSSLTEICGKMAITFDPYNINDLAQVIRQTLDQPRAIDPEPLKNKFSWPAAARAVQTIIAEVKANS